ncbi:MAG: hypothetical protein J2P19_03785 [Pseudonocardia sp.]|nr:hypothetical protein [Pseudonocardia sp.]
MNIDVGARRVLAPLLLAAGAVLAMAPAADAASRLPTPETPHLTSVVVSGCQAPCAAGKSGEVTLTWTNPTPPAGATVLNYAYADGFNIGSPTTISRSGDTVRESFPICAGVHDPTPGLLPGRRRRTAGERGDDRDCPLATGNPDDGTLQISDESAHSNGLVPTQD